MLILFFEAMSCDLWNKYLAFTFTTKVAPQLPGGTSQPHLQTHVFNTVPSLPDIYQQQKMQPSQTSPENFTKISSLQPQ